MTAKRRTTHAGSRPTPTAAPYPTAFPALEGVVREITILFHRLRAVAEEVHHDGQLSGGRREVLRDLDRDGALTVPQLARSRSFSRQHAQVLVNSLQREGLVELRPNPAHRRSPLVRVTETGRARLAEMVRREQRLWAAVAPALSPQQLAATETTLRTLRELFEGEAWQGALEGDGASRVGGDAPRPRPPRPRRKTGDA